jgi:hypothetical protein
MTIVVDPGGTPSIIYNRDGTTISSLASAGTNQSTAAQIVRYSGWDIVLVTYNAGAGVKLPSNSEIGDIVELHLDVVGLGIECYPESGAQINFNGANSSFAFSQMLFRKVAAGSWVSLSCGTSAN